MRQSHVAMTNILSSCVHEQDEQLEMLACRFVKMGEGGRKVPNVKIRAMLMKGDWEVKT